MEIKAIQLGAVGKASHDTPAKLGKAAKEFEALIIGQMLKSVRESSFGGGWGTGDQAGDTALEMADQQMSQMLASNGGLGLARLITKGLEQRLAATAEDPAVPPNPAKTGLPVSKS